MQQPLQRGAASRGSMSKPNWLVRTWQHRRAPSPKTVLWPP